MCFDYTEQLICKVSKMKVVDIANSIDPDEVAHKELPHLDLV